MRRLRVTRADTEIDRAHSRPCRRRRNRTASHARNRHAERRKSVRSTQRQDRFERQLRIRRAFRRGGIRWSQSRNGYLEQNFDQPSPFARYRLLELAEGEQLDGMDFRLHRGAVITGVITDEAGDPLPDVSVQVMRERFGPDGRSLSLESRTPVPIRTDDEGRYRVYALRPGMYVVTATADRSDDPSLSFGRTYYPGTMNESEAQLVRVDFGQDAVAELLDDSGEPGPRVWLRSRLRKGALLRACG